jgi:hypothetical protein
MNLSENPKKKSNIFFQGPFLKEFFFSKHNFLRIFQNKDKM